MRKTRHREVMAIPGKDRLFLWHNCQSFVRSCGGGRLVCRCGTQFVHHDIYPLPQGLWERVGGCLRSFLQVFSK